MKIRMGMYKKKVPRDIIDKTLKASYSSDAEGEQAIELLDRQKQRFLRKKREEKRPKAQAGLRILGAKRLFCVCRSSRGSQGFQL